MKAWQVGLPVAALLAAAWACSDDPVVQTCRNIPAGGCPGAIGAACNDPTCAAVYTCAANGEWVLAETCPPHDAGPDTSAPLDAGPDVSGLRDVDIDVPGANGGPGCADLEPPDCPLGLAAACSNGQCCGCEDLFVCADGGWAAWGTCGDGGALVPAR